MTINLNQSPYYDDYNRDTGYTKVLAVPGRVDQSRETNVIQSMIQQQIQDLFSTIYKEGQVISGCKLTVVGTTATVSTGSLFAYGRIWTFSSPASITITGVGTEIIGVDLQEAVITELQDPTLLDPAAGYTNYMQPGAHRLRQRMIWQLITTTGLGIFTLVDGAVPAEPTTQDLPVTEQVLDIIARRDYERYGNYIIEGLKVTLSQNDLDPWNTKALTVGFGKASIRGYDTKVISDWSDTISIARDTGTISEEPYNFTSYNSYNGTGAQKLLAQKPVAAVNEVVATVLTVDGYGSNPNVTRGSITGGSDSLSNVNVLEIVAVNQGGTWDPATETFTGGSTFNPSYYQLTGNKVDWSPTGSEPAIGSSYSVAYKYRATLTLEVVEMTSVSNEERTHDDVGGNELTYSFACESNDYTGVVIEGMNTSGGTPVYTYGTDFTITNGVVDWYEYDIQIIEMTKGSDGGVDNISGFTNGFSMGTILDVAYYSNPASASFDEVSGTFESPDGTYYIDNDWTYSVGVNQIDWSPDGAEPTTNATYFVAVRARKYLTANHPSALGTYFINYSYWKVITPGDYLARNSFYVNYDGPGEATNVPQVYGLDFQDSVNFWKATSYNNNLYNTNKPYPGTLVEFDYEYYLPRYVIIRLDPTVGIVKVYGNSSLQPKEPLADINDVTLDLALIYCPADSLSMVTVDTGNRIFSAKDTNTLLDRVTLLQSQMAITWLDIQAASLRIPNQTGLLAVQFVNNDYIDQGWDDVTYSIDPNWQHLALPHTDSFVSTSVDTDNSTTQMYKTISTLIPNGSNSIEQTNYTGHESIAPYALAGQAAIFEAQSATLSLTPSSDTLIIPRTSYFTSLTDANAWIASDVSKLTNPTQWFSKGWTGGTETRIFGSAYTYDFAAVVTSNSQTETLTSTYIRDIKGNCRQIQVAFNVPGGLVPTSEMALNYFLYFGGVLVTPTLDAGTPAGTVAGSFRPNTNRGASGTFTIPANIPEGRIEVKIMSSVAEINGSDWRQIVVATFDAAVVEQLTLSVTQCRCNCYCNCWCNCYNCRGRCGTGPLAQTIEPIGIKRFIGSVDLDFYSVHPTYGVYACIVTTENGQPTSNTIEKGMIARKYLNAAQLAGAGIKTFTFDDPILMEDDAYSIVATGEDYFNLNSIQEIAAGRDIRLKIATLGEVDIVTGKVVGTQPFKAGILWRSLTGVTWEQDQTADLKFKATFLSYPINTTQIVYLDTVNVTEATAFFCAWNSTQVDGTKIVFEYRTNTGLWTEFTPYSLTFMSEVTNTIDVRAKLSTTISNVTPLVENFASFYVQSTQPELYIVTTQKTVPASDTLDIYLDSILPTGASQDVKVTFDEGDSWTDLDSPVGGNPSGNLVGIEQVDANQNNVTYRYHWTVSTSPSTFTGFRVSINGTVIGSTAQLSDPRFANLIAIASNSI